MVLTALQVLNSFTVEMVILPPTITQLQSEEIVSIKDQEKFDKASLQQIASNIYHSGEGVKDHNDTNSTISTPPFILGATSPMRMVMKADMMQYYS